MIYKTKVSDVNEYRYQFVYSSDKSLYAVFLYTYKGHPLRKFYWFSSEREAFQVASDWLEENKGYLLESPFNDKS